MHRRHPLLVLLSLFVAGVTAWNCTMVLRYSGLPFALEPAGPRAAQIEPLRELPLPAGLHEGDRVEYADQKTLARMNLFAVIEFSSTDPGHILPLTVTRQDGSRVKIPVPARRLSAEPAFHLSTYLGLAWFILALAISLMTLWRGRGRAAWGIAFWAIAFECGMALYLTPAHDWSVLALALASQICYLAARIGFFLMADAVAAHALSPRLRRAFRAAFMASLVIGYAYEVTYSLWFIFGGVLIPPVATLIWVVPYAIATTMLLAGHHSTAAGERPRLRWMFWSGMILTFGILLSNMPLFGYAASYPIQIFCYLIAFSGLLYSVLRHRVIDMRFVVNRAIVYSATLGVVAVIFVLLESFAEGLALGKRESLILEFGVPLVIGFSFETIRKRLENLGERLFFRRKFENEKALRAFARQCAYIEHPDHLLEEALRELGLHTGTPAAAVYWHEYMEKYQKIAQSGAEVFPGQLDRDDRAIVAMRAEHRTAGLHGLASTLGEDGLALPMLGRGELLGFIVIANRPGEAFPHDERELLGHLAHQVGAAMLALRARANALLVGAIASGSMSEEEIRARARILMPPG